MTRVVIPPSNRPREVAQAPSAEPLVRVRLKRPCLIDTATHALGSIVEVPRHKALDLFAAAYGELADRPSETPTPHAAQKAALHEFGHSLFVHEREAPPRWQGTDARVVVIKDGQYDTRFWQRGECLTVSQAAADALQALGMVRLAEPGEADAPATLAAIRVLVPLAIQGHPRPASLEQAWPAGSELTVPLVELERLEREAPGRVEVVEAIGEAKPRKGGR